MVEYALLVAGIALTAVLGIAVLGHKTADLLGVVAATIPGAHSDDNKPLAATDIIPIDTSGSTIRLNSTQLVQQGGLDRFEKLLGPGAGSLLIADR